MNDIINNFNKKTFIIFIIGTILYIIGSILRNIEAETGGNDLEAIGVIIGFLSAAFLVTWFVMFVVDLIKK